MGRKSPEGIQNPELRIFSWPVKGLPYKGEMWEMVCLAFPSVKHYFSRTAGHCMGSCFVAAGTRSGQGLIQAEGHAAQTEKTGSTPRQKDAQPRAGSLGVGVASRSWPEL